MIEPTAPVAATLAIVELGRTAPLVATRDEAVAALNRASPGSDRRVSGAGATANQHVAPARRRHDGRRRDPRVAVNAVVSGIDAQVAGVILVVVGVIGRPRRIARLVELGSFGNRDARSLGLSAR